MKTLHAARPAFAALAMIGLATTACSESDSDGHAHDGGGHYHADGTWHADDDHGHAGAAHDAGADHHDHGEEAPLPPATLGDMTVQLAQGHGPLKAGQTGHLVVKLPYNDNGATVVRAWISGIDHTLSPVGQGVYAPSHDDYDVSAVAPEPLPKDAMWWVEIEKPDGTKLLGSTKPITE